MEDNQEKNSPRIDEIDQLPHEKSVLNPALNQKTPKKKLFAVMTALLIVIIGGIIGWIIFSGSHPLKNSRLSSKEIPRLVIANQDKKNIFYPDFANSDYANTYNFQSFEGLVRYEDQSKIVPALASSWSNPDELTWKFNLKKNVKFHTGKTMTADDVVYSYEIQKKNEDFSDLYLSTISSVKKIDAYTVEVKTTDPDLVLLNKLNFMTIIDRQSEGKKPSPIYGTGAYTLKPGTTPTESRLELIAFDDYHEGRPTTRELVFIRREEDEGLAQALLEKKSNISGEFINGRNESLEQKKLISREVPDTSITFLALNTIKPGPLQSLDVRRAIQAAIDVPMLIEKSNISAVPSSQLLVDIIPGYNPKITPVKRDVQKARQLLTKAGYPNGFTVELVDAGGYGETYKTILPAQLAEIGIVVKNRSMEDFSSFLDELTSGKIEIGVLSYSSDFFDGGDVFNATTSQLGLYQSQKLESILNEATSTTNDKERLALLQEAGSFVNDDVPVIPLYNVAREWYMDKEYKMKRDMPNSGMGVYFWKAHL
jgi:peptide/nickel transport system substrate-binding protein